jgi:hypothetical protein
LQDWIANRIPEVRRQIEARGVSCPDACVETEPEPCQFLECAGERRCEAGRWTTCLVDPDLEIPMNGVDDDCDRLVDETDPELVPDAGPEPDAPGDAGCCSASGSSPSDCLLTFLLAALLWRRRAPRSCSS